MLYLDIDMEVMLKNEESDRREMEFFGEIFDDLKGNLEKAKEQISLKQSNRAIKEDRDIVIKTLSDIGDMLVDIHGKDLKVAIMALKKSGKSVIVNCLLGEEYAPASAELPTFNSCIYRKSVDSTISLNYHDQQMIFKNPSEIKEYILDEFRSAHADKKSGYILDDMEIRYVPNADSLCSYTIIDTPGPDLAGSDHKRVAYKWIGEADVVVFIVDYAKHLTKSEEDFFRDIKAAFEEHNKIYSFIVVVNKLDLMYLSEEKKSAVRFIDFLRSKLKGLGYRGFIVLGISALQYFYSQKALRIKECAGLDTDDGYMLRECLNASLKRYQGMEEMTTLSFIDSQIRNLLWFHGREGATLKTLMEKSGVEQLIKYINYIAVEKASIEMFKQKVSLIDRRLAGTKDTISSQIVKLGEKREQLEKEMSGIRQFYEEVTGAMKERAAFAKDTGSMERDINLAHKSMLLIINGNINNIMKRLTKVLTSLSNDELILLQNGNNLRAVDEISGEIKRGSVEKNYLQVMGKYEKYINSDISEKEKAVQEQNRLMQSKVMEYNEYVKDAESQNIHIALPKLQPSFSSFDFPRIALKFDSTFYPHLFKGRLSRKRGLMGALLLILSFGKINQRTGGFKFDDIKLKKALFLIKKNLEESMQKWISEQNTELLSHIDMHLDALSNDVSEEMERGINSYKSIFDGIISELKHSMETIEARIEFLKGAEKSMEGFCSSWNEFRNKQKEA
ncbi:MAG: dynamin family protein [Nitrospirota bacterium]